MRPLPCFRICGTTAFDGQPDAAHVDRHQLIPLGRRDVPEGPHRQRREDRRVVDEDVDAAELVERRGGERIAARFVGDVGAHEMAVHLARHRLALVGVELGDHDPGALLGEALRVGAAEALAGAGDDRHLVAQSHRAADFAG